MPIFSLDDSISSILLDPTGKILAVAINTGVQFFHFNGAEPITPFTGIIGVTGYVTGMAWDNVGHLYAQNGAKGRMHVYEVTETSARELPDSPTAIPIGSFVVRTK
jgi:WD40 repeat protein